MKQLTLIKVAGVVVSLAAFGAGIAHADNVDLYTDGSIGVDSDYDGQYEQTIDLASQAELNNVIAIVNNNAINAEASLTALETVTNNQAEAIVSNEESISALTGLVQSQDVVDAHWAVTIKLPDNSLVEDLQNGGTIFYFNTKAEAEAYVSTYTGATATYTKSVTVNDIEVLTDISLDGYATDAELATVNTKAEAAATAAVNAQNIANTAQTAADNAQTDVNALELVVGGNTTHLATLGETVDAHATAIEGKQDKLTEEQLTAFTADSDTQLSEEQVVAFVANNGYATETYVDNSKVNIDTTGSVSVGPEVPTVLEGSWGTNIKVSQRESDGKWIVSGVTSEGNPVGDGVFDTKAEADAKLAALYATGEFTVLELGVVETVNLVTESELATNITTGEVIVKAANGSGTRTADTTINYNGVSVSATKDGISATTALSEDGISVTAKNGVNGTVYTHVDNSGITVRNGDIAILDSDKEVTESLLGNSADIDELQTKVNALETAGTSGSGTPGAPGEQGAPGTQGAKGDKGDKGDAGEQGAPGTQGAKGDKGDKGDAGEQGIQGAKGDKGDKGDAGATGKDGVTTIVHTTEAVDLTGLATTTYVDERDAALLSVIENETVQTDAKVAAEEKARKDADEALSTDIATNTETAGFAKALAELNALKLELLEATAAANTAAATAAQATADAAAAEAAAAKVVADANAQAIANEAQARADADQAIRDDIKDAGSDLRLSIAKEINDKVAAGESRSVTAAIKAIEDTYSEQANAITMKVNGNTDAITMNATAISNNSDRITANSDAIKVNADAIKVNAANIAENTRKINKNVEAIAALDARVSALESGGGSVAKEDKDPTDKIWHTVRILRLEAQRTGEPRYIVANFGKVLDVFEISSIQVSVHGGFQYSVTRDYAKAMGWNSVWTH